jgi:Family of unknown function (DUF6272)
MLASSLFELRAKLRAAGVIFAYCGYVTEPMLTGVGEALKQKLATEDMDTKTLRSVFAVFVEQMQNIIRYSAERQLQHPSREGVAGSEITYGVITIGRDSQGFEVEAGNLVHAADVEPLRSRLDRIRKADRAELKALYKEILKAGPEETSKGAGVGFIEIARRASKPIEFDFMSVDDQFTFFALRAEI